MMGLDVHDMEALGENFIVIMSRLNAAASSALHSCGLPCLINRDTFLPLSPVVTLFPS